jgi:hypothetical protein
MRVKRMAETLSPEGAAGAPLEFARFSYWWRFS